MSVARALSRQRKPSAVDRLPPEIILDIFAIAALSCSKTACALARVATWVVPVARASLYAVVTLPSPVHLINFHSSILSPSSPPPSLAGSFAVKLNTKLLNSLLKVPGPSTSHHAKRAHARSTTTLDEHQRMLDASARMRARLVKHFWAPKQPLSKDRLRRVLRRCPHITDLAIPGACLSLIIDAKCPEESGPSVDHRAIVSERNDGEGGFVSAGSSDSIHASGRTPLTSLTLNTLALGADWPFETHPSATSLAAFSSLTHLVLVAALRSSCVPLGALPALTHLAFPLVPGAVSRADMNVPHAALMSTADELLPPPRNDGSAEITEPNTQPTLQMLVMHFPAGGWGRAHRKHSIASDAKDAQIVRAAHAHDPRLYALPLGGDGEVAVRELWESSARGGMSIWDAARSVLAEVSAGAH